MRTFWHQYRNCVSPEIYSINYYFVSHPTVDAG